MCVARALHVENQNCQPKQKSVTAIPYISIHAICSTHVTDRQGRRGPARVIQQEDEKPSEAASTAHSVPPRASAGRALPLILE